MSFVRDHYESYDAPRLVVRLLHDSGGTPYLLLHGPEPDNRWEAFARAVREVLERLGVTRVVAMGSVPMAVPHTRPIAITPHANRPELVPGASPWRGELRIPSSAQSLLELRLGEWGHDMLGFVAHIPHYLAQLDYPKAAAVLLEQVELAGRLTIDLTELHELAARARDRDRPLPVLQRGGGRGGRGPGAAVRRLRARRGPGRRACSPTTSRCRPARRSAGSSSSSWPASTPRTATTPTSPGATGERRRLGGRGPAPPARPRDARRRPLPRRPPALGPGPGLRRAGGRAGAGGRHPQRGPGVRPALLPLLLPAARRLRGADHLRRRSGSGTAARSSPAGSRPASTAGRSTTRRSTSRSPRRASTTRTSCPTYPAPTRAWTCSS